MASRTDIRRDLRRRRRSLSPSERRRYDLEITRALLRSWRVRRRQRIAGYLAADGEVDVGVCMRCFQDLGKQCYLPGLLGNKLRFLAYTSRSALTPNRFGILEPGPTPRGQMRPRALDLVLTPLVAFDHHGNRLGMGGGYYDRSFAYRRHRRHWRRPILLGVAYSFQRVDELSPRPWDVPLDGVVTERGLLWFPLRPRRGG